MAVNYVWALCLLYAKKKLMKYMLYDLFAFIHCLLWNIAQLNSRFGPFYISTYRYVCHTFGVVCDYMLHAIL